MSIYAEHKCPGCGMELSFIVDNGMILRVPSKEEDDAQRRRVMSWDFERGRPEKGCTSVFRDLWAWLIGKTPGRPTSPTDFRSVCPRTGKIRDGDLKYAGTCGGYQCTHHTCAGASCSHCGGTGRCPEKAVGKK